MPQPREKIHPPGEDRLSLVRAVMERVFWVQLLKHLRSKIRFLILGLAVSLILSLAIMPFDNELMAWMSAHTGPVIDRLAIFFTNVGAFDGVCIYPVSAMFVWGWVRRRSGWKNHAMLYLFMILLVGLAANILRGGLGRSRPGGADDGWHGPTIQTKYNSFPSAHAAVSFGAFAYTLAFCPPLSVPVLFTAEAVCWSRVQLGRHHPSDIIFGAGLGFFISFVVTSSLRKTLNLSPSGRIMESGDSPA